MKRLTALLATAALALAPAAALANPPAPTVVFAGASVALTSNVATLTATGACAAGARMVLASSTTASRNITGITDTGGNTWASVTGGFAGSNMYQQIWSAPATTGLSVGNTITVTYAATTTTAHFIVACQTGVTGVDATGKGNTGGLSTTEPRVGSNSASPPTSQARSFFAATDNNNFSSVIPSTVTDPNSIGWTSISTVGTTDGMGLFYQDNSAGATSTLQFNAGGANIQWGIMWGALDFTGGGGGGTFTHMALTGAGK
jgi:hypothetical protein